MVRITDFFWSRESYTLSCRHISQGGFVHSDTFFFSEGRGGGRGSRTVFCPPVLILCIAFDLGRVVRRPISLTRVLFSFVQKYFPG